MYKILNAESLGISGRQNELIELALTYKFCGLDIDIDALMSQVESRGRDHALRYIQSAPIRIGGLELPAGWMETDDAHQKYMERLTTIAELAASLGIRGCTVNVLPYNVDRPYHANFEFHRERLAEIADQLSQHDIRLGIGFAAPISCREGHDSQFIAAPDTLLTLIKTIVSSNIGLSLDLWHWHVGGGTVEQLQELPIDSIVTVRLADVPADADLETITEEQRLLPGSSGVVPASETMKWLAEAGYDGPVTAYGHPAQFSGITRTRAVEQASDALVQLMKHHEQGEVAAEAAAVAD